MTKPKICRKIGSYLRSCLCRLARGLERLLHYMQPSILGVSSSSFTRECQRLPEMIASGAQELHRRVKIAAVKK